MKALVLLSTGIDSPVAAKIAQNKGLELLGINFYSKTLTKEHKRSILELAKLTGINKVYFVDHNKSHKEYANNCNLRYQCVFCKRNMLRISQHFALKNNCDFLITGDNIGQVATQTVHNMCVVSSVTKMLILRPLLTYDKNDCIAIAKEIGSFKINNDNNFPCPYLPKNPVTKLDESKILIEENKIDLDEINSELIIDVESVNLTY